MTWARRVGRLAPLGAFLTPLAVAGAMVPLRGQVAAPASALVLVVAVAAVAAPGRRLWGLLATVSAALFYDLLLTRPYGHLNIADRTEAQCSIALVVVGVAVTELAARGRRYWLRAADGRRQLVLVAEVAAVVAAGEPADGVLTHALAAITELLSARRLVFDEPGEGPPLARITPAGEVLHVGLIWDSERLGLPGPQFEVPVRFRGRDVGRFVGSPTPGLAIGSARLAAAAAIAEIVAPVLTPARDD